MHTIGIITDDILSNRMQNMINALIRLISKGNENFKDIKSIHVGYPMHKPTQAQSIAITVDKPIQIKIENTLNINNINVYYYGFNSKPADVFLFFYKKGISNMLFGPNDTTHSGYANLVSSTVALLQLAKHFNVKANSISTKNYTHSYEFILSTIFDTLDKGYYAYNFFDTAIPMRVTVDNQFHDYFEAININGRDAKGWYWVSYTKAQSKDPNTDVFNENLKRNYYTVM